MLCLLCHSSHAVSSTPEALFLDMGAYQLAPQHQTTSCEAAQATAGKDLCLQHSNSYSSSSSSASSSKAPGRLQQPSFLQLGAAAVAALLTRKSSSTGPTPTAANVRPHHQHTEYAAASELAAGSDAQQQQQQQACGEELHVYQVLHPALVGRAHVLGNELQLREVQQVTDLPFFDAPGRHFGFEGFESHPLIRVLRHRDVCSKVVTMQT
jgi:hypothetical protein